MNEKTGKTKILSITPSVQKPIARATKKKDSAISKISNEKNIDLDNASSRWIPLRIYNPNKKKFKSAFSK